MPIKSIKKKIFCLSIYLWILINIIQNYKKINNLSLCFLDDLTIIKCEEDSPIDRKINARLLKELISPIIKEKYYLKLDVLERKKNEILNEFGCLGSKLGLLKWKW